MHNKMGTIIYVTPPPLTKMGTVTGGNGGMEIEAVSLLHDVLYATALRIIGITTNARANTSDMNCLSTQNWVGTIIYAKPHQNGYSNLGTPGCIGRMLMKSLVSDPRNPRLHHAVYKCILSKKSILL